MTPVQNAAIELVAQHLILQSARLTMAGLELSMTIGLAMPTQTDVAARLRNIVGPEKQGFIRS